MATESTKFTELISRTKQWVCVSNWAEEEGEEEEVWTPVGFSFWSRLTVWMLIEKIVENTLRISSNILKRFSFSNLRDHKHKNQPCTHTHATWIYTPCILYKAAGSIAACKNISRYLDFTWKECSLVYALNYNYKPISQSWTVALKIISSHPLLLSNSLICIHFTMLFLCVYVCICVSVQHLLAPLWSLWRSAQSWQSKLDWNRRV